jgi:hypothetical protein
MIRPIADVVETATIHADSLFSHPRRNIREGRKRLPLLLDCLCRVNWQRLRSVEVVMLGNRAERRSRWSFVSRVVVGRFRADHLLAKKRLAEGFSRLGGSLQQFKLHATLEGLVDMVIDRYPVVTLEQLRDGSWYDIHPEIHDPLGQIDSFLDILASSIPSLQDFTVQVHRTAQDVSRALESTASPEGNALTYTARIARSALDQQEIHVSSRKFHDNAEEAFRALCFSRIAALSGIDESQALAGDEMELHDDAGMETLRYEREEDVEGWETEEEWM